MGSEGLPLCEQLRVHSLLAWLSSCPRQRPISLYLTLFISPADTARAERGKINTMFHGQAKKGPMDPRRGAGGEKGGMRFDFSAPLHYGPNKSERGPKS
jgi:hypothetical protein